MVVAGGPAVADPLGSNGFIKVVTVDDGAEIPQNIPHVPCSFKVQWFNFDEGPDPDDSDEPDYDEDEDESYVCDIDNEEFDSLDKLDEHREHEHPDD